MEALDDDVLIRSELTTHTDIKKPASPVGFFTPSDHPFSSSLFVNDDKCCWVVVKNSPVLM